MAITHIFPESGINVPLAALMGMSAMFAGASRAYLTSIAFALEATGQFHALLPLLGACTASYIVSFFLMENTIMTEKIARRGVFTPDSYEPDVLMKLSVAQVIDDEGIVLDPQNTIQQVRDWLKAENNQESYFIMADKQGNYTGTVQLSDIYRHDADPAAPVESINKTSELTVNADDNLRTAVEAMSMAKVEALPVTSAGKVIGVLSYKDIIDAYNLYYNENEQLNLQISLKRQRLKMLIRGKAFNKTRTKN